MGQAVARGKTTAQMAEEAATAYRLQLEGWTVDAIADHLGVSVGTVCNRIKAAAAERVHPHVDEMRAVQTDRLHAMYAALRPRIAQGDPAAVGAGVRVSERLSRLWGLDAQPGAAEAAVEASLDASGDVVASVLADTLAAVVDVAVDDPVWRGKLEQFGLDMAAWCLSGRPDGGRPIAPERPAPVVVEAEVFPGRLRPEQEAALRDPSSPFFGLGTLLSEIVDAEVVDGEDVAAEEGADAAGGDRGASGADFHGAGVDAGAAGRGSAAS